MSKELKARQEESIASLKSALPVGSKVYGVIMSVARSGMSRRIAVMAADGQGGIRNFSFDFSSVYHDGNINGWEDGVRIGGCGMDMNYHLITSVARAVHGDEKAWTVERL